MRFENAYKGIGNIITAEVLSIIATVTGVLTAVFGAVAYAAEMEKIKEVLDYPGNSVYVVKGEHEYMIPAVKAFILDTNLDTNSMQVKLIEGMRSDEN